MSHSPPAFDALRRANGPFSSALVLEEPDPSLDRHLAELGIDVHRPPATPDEDQLVALLEERPYELLYKRSRVPITERVLDAAPNLFAVMLCCIGDDSVDKPACAQRGVLVTNDPVSNGRSVVELVLGELICLSRRVFEAVDETARSEFVKTQRGRFEVRGKTLGILGLGNIGKQVAQVAETMGMKVIFHDSREVAREVGETIGWQPVPTIEELFSGADYVTVHVSAHDSKGRSNAGLLRYEHFRAMGDKEHPSPRCFINTSRGFLFDPADLIRAVDEGHVQRASIDVYPEEPRNRDEAWQNPYAGHDRIVGTPHIGAATVEAQPRIARHVAGTTELLSLQGTLRNCVFDPKQVIGVQSTSDPGWVLTVAHSTKRGTKKAIDDAIYEAGADNVQSAHRDFHDYDLAYDVTHIDQPLSDAQIDHLVDLAAQLTGDPGAIRAVRQVKLEE